MDLFSVHLHLSDLNDLVSEILAQAIPGPLWVIAEVASITRASSGHTYLDLVEKRGDEVVAQSRAQLWSSRRDVLATFERTTRSRLDRGMQILLQVQPTFHKRYGYGLDVRDIDASFTIGDMARKRQEVIERLAAAGLLMRNQTLELSEAPLRIAVISSATAAGWEDFSRVLALNVDRYAFAPTLFEAIMQGDAAAKSVVSALAKIAKTPERFDCVAILRGGGSTVDLSCFDSFEIGKAIAECPLPVISGIGHDRDQAVSDMVAYLSVPTPTAAAQFLIVRVQEYEGRLDAFGDAVVRCAGEMMVREIAALQNRIYRVITTSQQRVRTETDALQGFLRRGSMAVHSSVARHTGDLTGLATRAIVYPRVRAAEHAADIERLQRDLVAATGRRVGRAEDELTRCGDAVTARDPADVLRRGYSITRRFGRAIKRAADAPPGARIETSLYDGRIESIVETMESLS